MLAPLATCLLASLLATGACLQCEMCSGQGQNCTGSLQPCPPGQDSCGTILTEVTLVGIKSLSIFKGCIMSSQCKAGPLLMNFGTEVTSQSVVACCVGDACRTANVTMPPANTTLNGRRCPSCFAVTTDHCLEEPMECFGAETYCINTTGTTATGATPMELVMRGCVSNAMCTHVKAGFSTVGGISLNLTTDKCTAASGAEGTGPGAAGLLLPALAGLLLLKLHP